MGKIISINGPVVKAYDMQGIKMGEMVLVGDKKCIGEIIILEGDLATIQVYEETSGLSKGEQVIGTGNPLCVNLGPGIIGQIFDGIERPLKKIDEGNVGFIKEGVGLVSIDENKLWEVKFLVKADDILKEGDIFGEVKETDVIVNELMVPKGAFGKVFSVKQDGKYNLYEKVLILKEKDKVHKISIANKWPVRKPRPIKERKKADKLLVTGQRIIDSFFPLAKGGTAAIPGGFGTGKTMMQHSLAMWCDADIIVYIGCGERGNEMTEVLEDFPKLIDPRTGKSLMERTVLIANTSNMPVAAREASIYTGITIAEYYRDMGYHVAIMADSTSRWAEALREISGRLEEMPAEEGYPAYLPYRLAQFYERAGYVQNLNDTEGSITIIGAISPAGGDFSEPVTQNTKMLTSCFFSLDKNLAYGRHYPAINWLSSYSSYVEDLKEWYEENDAKELPILRKEILKILFEENKLNEIVKLVGEDVLPDEERLVLVVAKLIKIGILQQNAYHKNDNFVTIIKQSKMLKVVLTFYKTALKNIKKGANLTSVYNEQIFDEIIKMKYNISNNELYKFDKLLQKIRDIYGLEED